MDSKKKLIWNSLIYSFKSALGILFPLITFPYVSNILGPTNIGKVAYANSLTNYFIFLAALGITTYAVREGAKVKDDEEALSKLSVELLIINCISSFIAYIGILIICQIPLFSDYALLILLNSLMILFTTIGMEWVYNVKEEFTYITIRYLIVQILAIVFLFTFVKSPEDYYYYAVYLIITAGGSNVINVFGLRKHILIFKKRKLELKRHIKPLMLLFSISITATIFSNLDTTMLGLMKGEAEVGIFQAGTKIYTIATNVLASISLVVFSRTSYLLKDGDLSENGKFKRLIEHFNGLMMVVAAPITVGLIAISTNLTGFLLSEEYRMSGYVLMIISLNIFSSAIGRIYGHQILIGTNHDSQYFKSTVIGVVIDVGLNLILIPYLGAIATAISTIVACLISNIYVIYCASKITTVNRMIIISGKYVLLSLPFLVISLIVNQINTGDFIKMALIICGCVVYYGITLLTQKDPYLYEVLEVFLRLRRKKSVN